LILFASDLHLCPARPGTVHLFKRFLEGPARQAEALYLLGDLFEYWAGDDDLADPFNARICAAIAKVGACGTAVHFLPGNRDFLVSEGFLAATGARLLPDEIIVDIAGTPTLLMHGDTLCTDDAEYQRFRAMVRGERWRREFLALPLAERRARIEDLRTKSEREKQVKSYEIMDVAAAAVNAAFRCHEVARLIHGHTHRPARHVLDVGGRACERWVLPDWREDIGGGYLECDAAGCRPVPWTS
jgi:UDP-2,3-diacylglucosamine hydrolase